MQPRLSQVFLAVLAASALMLEGATVDARCMPEWPNALMLTPLDAPVPPDGALLVRFDYNREQNRAQVRRSSAGLELQLALVRNAERIELRATRLPGGLMRFDFPTPPAPGPYQLEGFMRTPRQTVLIGGALPDAPAAPSLAAITHRETRAGDATPSRRRYAVEWTTSLQLAEPLGPTAAALVLRPAGGRQDGQLFTPGPGETQMSESAGLGAACTGSVTGRGRVAVGRSVHAVVVDVYGRVSRRSRPIRVRRPAVTEPDGR